jgi:CDP-diglyceride synthetase
VLGVRFGANPNSSSLGVDVMFLLFGAAFASAVALVLGAFLRAPGSRATQVGDAATEGRDSPPEGGSST